MRIDTLYLPFDVSLLPARMLAAGNLKCMYENGNLRYISLHGSEVVRMIYSAARDENWTTATYKIHDETVEESEEGFAIKYTAFYQLDHIRYKALFEIEGKDNTISFAMKGVALSNFKTNRIGICIHHPINECAGKKVMIKRADGSSYAAVFPELINPDQPFKQVQQMLWTTAEGVQADVTFEGDVFETEDQRNWTDASYKTYSRPLDLPFPYPVNAGETIEQRITLKILGYKTVSNQPGLNTLAAAEIKVPFPNIGYCHRKGFRHLTDIEISLLQKIPFNHYRVELSFDEKDWKDELAQALSEAKQLDTKLELVVLFGNEIDDELKNLTESLQHEQQYISGILVLDQQHPVTPHELCQPVYNVFKNALPGIKTGYGTDGFFAELNRNRPRLSSYDFVSFSINPQVHAVDTRSLIENLSAQADTIKTAQSFTGNKEIHVSPVTLKIRGNHGTAIDERLHTSFGAWWTLQTIKNLSGANSITFYETVGAKGIIKESEFSTDETQPAEDLLTPVYKVLKAIKAFRPEYIIKQNSNDENADHFLLENKEGERLMFIGDNYRDIKDK